MSFERPGQTLLDYKPWCYGGARLRFRGPQKELCDEFVLCFGGTETYGKFISRPYPDLLEAETGMQTVNMGSLSAGVDAFLSEPELLEAANQAASVVVQIPGAHTLSNRFYTVHPRHNDRFLRPSETLRVLYPQMDFTDIAFTGHLLTALYEADPSVFATVVDEIRQAWTRRMTLLLNQIDAPTVLLWMGSTPPPSAPSDGLPDMRRPHGPLFVDQAMIDEVTLHANRYVEVTASNGARASGTRGMTYGELDGPAAAALPGPRTHEEVAGALAPAMLEITGGSC